MRQVDIKDFEDYQITDDGRVWSKKTILEKKGIRYVEVRDKRKGIQDSREF